MGLFDDAASVISHKSPEHRSQSHSRSHLQFSSPKDNRRSGTFPVRSAKSRSAKSRSAKSRSHSRSRSPRAKSIAASLFGLGGSDDDNKRYRRHSQHEKRGSGLFGLPNLSTRSFFGGGDKHRASTSHYRRSPRTNFLRRAYKQLKRLLRDLVYYAKRHPVKVFTLVVLPLLTGGFLTALLARFGLRLPTSIERMLGLGARVFAGGGGAGTIGLMGEAVRMASEMGAGGAHADVRVERGHNGGMQWERKSWEREGDYGGGWGASMMKTVTGFFD